MLNKKKTETTTTAVNAFNVIGEGTKINGDISSNGDLRVDGIIEGTVHTKAKFILGPTGRVSGNIMAKNSDISGEVKGNVKVEEILYLKASARINGDIETNKLIIESGGEFNGKCIMGKQPVKLNEHNHERISQENAKAAV